MLKNIYLSMTFALATCAPIAYASTPINIVTAAAKKDIMLEIRTALTLIEKAEKHFRDLFQDAYEAKKQLCLEVLKIIATSSEFISTLEEVTDKQVRLITQEMVTYNDIIVDPTVYSLEQKVEAELSLAAFDAQEEQLFNVLYVVYAIVSGCKMLINKLELVEKELNSEQPLDAIDQAPQA